MQNYPNVNLIKGEITEIKHDKTKIEAIKYKTSEGHLKEVTDFDQYVVWAGVGSIWIADKLSLKLPLYGIKGHSINVYTPKEHSPDGTYLHYPDKICVSRLGWETDGLNRLTGFADLDGLNLKMIPWRMKRLNEYAQSFFLERYYDETTANHWVGLRPTSADDCPIIGKSSKFSNLYWNTGHGARGVMLSPGSAVFLEHIMTEQKLSDDFDPSLFDPKRFAV